MESYEHVTKVWIEAQGFVVSSGVKFPVERQTGRKDREEFQEHGYEVDLVAARLDKLVLVNVKSYFGSKGLKLERLKDEKIFSSEDVWNGILARACDRYGYALEQIELWVVAGRIVPRQKKLIVEYLEDFAQDKKTRTQFFDAADVAQGLVEAIRSKTYINDPVIATVRTLREAGLLRSNESDANTPSKSKGRPVQPHD